MSEELMNLFTISLVVCLFFLIWAFFLTTMTHCLTRLGESHATEIIEREGYSFYYGFLHRLFFKFSRFELLIFSCTLGENIARLGFVAFAAIGLIYFESLTSAMLIVFLIIFLFVILLVGDFFPRYLSIRSPEQSLAVSLPFASFFLFLSFPFSFIFLKILELALRARRKVSAEDPFEEARESIVQILRACNFKGKFNPADKKLMESVIRFKDRIVREVMVPRVDLFLLPAELTLREAAQELILEGYSRIPVYKETIDNIIGVLMFKDILQLYMDCLEGKKESELLNIPIEQMSKGVFYTPETKKVAQLLQEFRAKQMHMAIVVDEYGGTEGVVTMEDILEEIVGDIADEYDTGEEQLYTTQPGGGGWIVDARMSILDAEMTFNIHIPQEGEYDTIGGYIFHRVGSIPQKGLRIHHEDFDLEILSSSERSVEKVRITPLKKEE
jgi:CBS domain containing-hemolysin-like protein